MSESRRQLKAMLRKNWLLKIRHPYITFTEIFLPTVVMLMLIAVRTQVDTRMHSAQPYIRKEMLVEVGKDNISPPLNQILERLVTNNEYLAFTPNSEETRVMINIMSLQFPLLKSVARVYKDELELEAYIRSDLYGTCNHMKNCSNPKIKGAVVFHNQGPQLYDYSIRLNHTWAFSGFPDVKTIMDVNGPYLNDLELGVNTIPIMQYGFSGFLTLQQVLDSFIIFAVQQMGTSSNFGDAELTPSSTFSSLRLPSVEFIPSNIRLVPFPSRAYTDDEFQYIVKRVMGVMYLLGFLYPISRLISYSVFEKEQKIKEGLYMMGLKSEIFHISWFITYAVQFAVSSAIITIFTMCSLFKYSDKSLVFTYFFSFGLSAITLSFMISTFFMRAKTAVAVGTLSFFGAFFPYYTVNDPDISLVLKAIASLLSPTAFALGSINFADYERAHVGLRWSNIWRESSGVNFLICLSMMIFDTVLYCAIGVCLEKVFPKEDHTRFSWTSVLPKCLRRNKDTIRPHIYGSGMKLEAISLEMKQQEVDCRCLQIRDLSKVYFTKKGVCCAVSSLQLSLYENQILALLGHNGAGKSTTISMLVGLIPPTYGDALVCGRNILTDMDDIRKDLGVCPQSDILFPELTVKEHLVMYGILKGVKENVLESAVAEMINEVGLADKINTFVSALSGGMKRKLSLGIALIGDSKVIILDEPTSGMDPYSMRLTWQLIKKIKKGRIVLLTTHSMDEAEALGDRIAIMGNGSLKCCGSSLYLKQQYGVGYTLTLVKIAAGASLAADIVRRHIPSATIVSEVGTEISFKLPLASSSCFEDMFREIESCMKKSASCSDAGAYENEYAGIESYGISVTTLEEVFLRVAGSEFDETECAEQKTTLISPVMSQTPEYHTPKKLLFARLYGSLKDFILVLCVVIARTCGVFFASVFCLINTLSMRICCASVITSSDFWQHSKALLKKRAISARRDQKTIVFQLVIPVVFLLVGLLFLKLKPHPDQISVTFTTSNFNTLLQGGGGAPIPFDLSYPISKEIASLIDGGWIQEFKPSPYRFPDSEKALADAIKAAGPRLGPRLLSMSEFLMYSLNQSYQSRYGAIMMDNQNEDGSLSYTVLHNSSCQHAAPTYINLMNSAILKLSASDGNMTITTRNHPLPMTKSQHLQRHDLDAFSVAIIVTIAFSFIPASFAVPIVKEREVKAKHQQLLSGVSILSYWVSTYVWDFVSFLFPSSFAIALFYIFGLDQFVGIGCFCATVLLFLEFGLAVASSTYCLTFFFYDHSLAQNVILLVHFFTGLILMVISFIMDVSESTAAANSYLKNIFRLSPGFCFADGLASLALLRQGMKDKSSHGVLDWNVTGASIFYLAIESVFYFLLTLGLEVLPPHKLFLHVIDRCFGRVRGFCFGNASDIVKPLLSLSPDAVSLDLDEDVDVAAERSRVLSGAADRAILYLRNLRKVYPGREQSSKVAVQSLTFAVHEGECFGFLGTNGAGKTTTLSMLSGEEYPSEGTAFIFGKDILSDTRAARRHIGYCPQFDALLEYLTVKEHLELYARIKRVPDHRIEEVRRCALVYLENAFKCFKSEIVTEKASELILSSLENCMSSADKLGVFKAECDRQHEAECSDIIHVLGVVRVSLPYLSDQVSVKVVKKLVELLDARFSAFTRLILGAIEAFFDKADVQVIDVVAEEIIGALLLYVSSKSNSTDSLVLAANLLKTALDKMHSFDTGKWHKYFPSVVKAIGGLLACEDDIVSASSNVLKKLIDNQLVDFESREAIEVDQESNAIASICSDFMSLLESFPDIPSEHTLGVLSVLFLKLGRKSSLYMRKIILKLAEIFITAKDNECDTSHLQKCFGCAVVALGAEDILTLVPIVFNAENLTCSNVWLLPILKKYTFGASLRYFMDHIVPVAKSLKKSARKVKKSVTGKDLQAHAKGLWSLLPAFCRHPTDVSESFQPLSKLMLNQLKKDASRHEDIAEALQELVRSSKYQPKCDAAIAESPERSSDILLEDDLLEKRGLIPFSKKDANRNIKALSSQSNELLQALLTLFLDSAPKNRSNLKKAISCLASISKSSRAKKNLILSLERFPVVKGVIESGELSDASQNDLPSSVSDESQWSLSLDLASSFVEGADEDFLGLIFRLAKHSLQAKDEKVVREAYCTLNCILKDHPTFCSSKFDDLVDLISNLESPADIGSFRNRLSCLRILLVSVLKTSSDVENTKPFQVLNYIILALKDSKEDARKIAYDELLKIGSCLEESSSANSCELYNKLISMILGYLSGSSPHVTSAAVSALSVLVFKEPELCVKVPDLVPSVTSLLQTKAIEVIKAVLGFIKVFVSCLEGKDLHNFSSIIMDGLLPWSSVSRHHFRSKVTVIIEILIRKCGFPAVKLVTPERYQPFIKKVSLNRQGKSISKEDDSVDMKQQNSDVPNIGSKKRMRNESHNDERGSRFNPQKRQKQGQGSHNDGGGSRFNREKSRNGGQGSYPPRKVERTDFRSSRKPGQFNQKKAGFGRKSENPKMNRDKAFGRPRQNGPRNKQR